MRSLPAIGVWALAFAAILTNPALRAQDAAPAPGTAAAAEMAPAAISAGPAVGDAAKAFIANDDAGEVWNSAEHIGAGKYIVLYFYPAAMTGGCTKQACAYRDNLKALEEADVEVVAVSGDSVHNLALFKKANNLNFTLLSDIDGAVAREYGVPVKAGGEVKKTIDGIDEILKRAVTTSRWTFVIDKTGKIVYKDDKVKAAEDSGKIAEFIKAQK